jgi:hypothetical protein
LTDLLQIRFQSSTKKIWSSKRKLFILDQRVLNRENQLSNGGREQPPNGADSEYVHLGELAGIDNEPLLAQAPVKFLEGELRISGEGECDNNVTLRQD